MASLIPDKSPPKSIPGPLTLTALQTYVGGFIRFIELASGDIMVVNEAGPAYAPINEEASRLANRVIHGTVVLCSPKEIA